MVRVSFHPERGVQRRPGQPGLEREPADDHRGQESGRHRGAAAAERALGGETEVLAAAPRHVAQGPHVGE